MASRPLYSAGPSAAPFAVTINTAHELSCYYYVGVGGDVSIVTPDGRTVVYKGVPSGGYVWAASTKVNTSGTTATDIVRPSVIPILLSPPRTPRATLRGALEAAGVWDKLDVFQVYAAATSAEALEDWKGNSNATLVNSPTFTANRGFVTNRTNSYINTGWKPSVGVNYLQNNSTLGYWNNTYAGGDGGDDRMGGTYGDAPDRPSNNMLWNALTSSAVSYGIAHNHHETSQWNVSGAADQLAHGLLATTRTASDAVNIYAQGLLKSTSASFASTGRSAYNVYIGAANKRGTPSDHRVAWASAFLAGAALDATEMAALNTALTAYMDAIGNRSRPVAAWGDSMSNGTYNRAMGKRAVANGKGVRSIYNRGVSGETMAQIKTRKLADTTLRSCIQIIWGGRNDVNNTTGAITSTAATDLADMVADVPHDRYLVVGILNAKAGGMVGTTEAIGTLAGDAIIAWNAARATTYGSRFFDVRAELVAWALANGDANDQADAAQGLPPRSLLSDGLHLTTAGYNLVGEMLEDKIEALGW